MSRLTLAGVAGKRGGRTLFQELDLSLTDGAAAVVTGSNGAGKSTFIRIAAGLLAPAAGTVAREGNTALLSDVAALDAERSLLDALRWWAGIDSGTDETASALDAVGLAELAQIPVRWLSTGQYRRAGLARVVASRAPVWLLDEPANGLDTAAVEMLVRLVAEHRARGGIAVIATHVPLAVPDAVAVRL